MPIMKHFQRSFLTIVILVFFAACGRKSEELASAPPPERDVPAELTVNNTHWLDVVVYVSHDGELTRVGTVTAVSTANFSLAPWMLGQQRLIRLVGDPVGEPGVVRTDLLNIQPGQMIEWRLESKLARSSVMVY
jgi:hypothetical protein